MLHERTDPACKGVSKFSLEVFPCLVPSWSHRRVVPAENERQTRAGMSSEGCRCTEAIESGWSQTPGQQRERRQEWGPGGQRILAAGSPGTEGIRGSLFEEEFCTSKERERNIACRGGSRW